MTDNKQIKACVRCGKPTSAKLDGVALCDDCYSVFGACCASEFEDDDLLSQEKNESNTKE